MAALNLQAPVRAVRDKSPARVICTDRAAGVSKRNVLALVLDSAGFENPIVCDADGLGEFGDPVLENVPVTLELTEAQVVAMTVLLAVVGGKGEFRCALDELALTLRRAGYHWNDYVHAGADVFQPAEGQSYPALYTRDDAPVPLRIRPRVKA